MSRRWEEMSKDELVEALHRFHDESPSEGPPPDAGRLKRDLEMHQIELEVQNRELRDAQRLLEDERSRYLELYDAAPLAYCTLDADGRIHEANLTTAKLFNISPSQVLDFPLISLVPAEKQAALRAHLRRCFVDGMTATSEIPFHVRGRGIVRVQMTSTSYQPGSPGRAGRTAMVDVTALKRSEERLGLLATVSQIVGRSFDATANVVELARLLVNQIFADICFVDFLSPDGQSLRRIAAEASVRVHLPSHLAGHFLTPPSPRGSSPLAQVLRSGQPILHEACQPLSLTGALAEGPERDAVAMACSAASILFVPLVTHGRVLGTLTCAAGDAQRRFTTIDLSFAIDVAARIAVAVDAARLYRQAEDAVRARDELLAIVSHDLRTPLTALRLSVSGLLATSPGLARRPLEVILHAGERMEAMVGDLLDVASLEAGLLALVPAAYDIDEILAELAELVEPLARAKQQTLTIARLGVSTSLVCDQRRVVQVLTNLVGNAIKFTPSGGVVVVTPAIEGERAWFTVADEGPGIPEAVRARVFERFQQARETASQGRGLGLYIARGLVESHGGEIGLEASQKGSRFRFWVPRSGLGRSRLTPVRAGHVMLVEPEPTTRTTMRSILETRGIAVTEAKDGDEALGLLRRLEKPPELILLAIDEPVLDGQKLLAELKKDLGLATIPVVVVAEDQRAAAAALRLGARGVVPKPVHAGTLLAHVVPKDGAS